MINIAGPEYDFGTVVFALLQECEHRRRSFENVAAGTRECVKEKLAEIYRTYAEFGGSATYWQSLEKEVLKTIVPQYIDAAEEMNELEESAFGVWRKGDLPARLVFALIGLIIGSILIAIPWIPIFETMFAFGLTAGGFVYPDVRRFVAERAYARKLNGLVVESAAYQANANLRYMTTDDVKQALLPGPPP
ncbi:MAG: hypothetical protein JWO56_67 [Acidobacteria bacterium]|nr:hypothetical protein [Acidobacteriota bacterium]